MPVKYWVVDKINGHLNAADAYTSAEVTNQTFVMLQPTADNAVGDDEEVVPGTAVFLFAKSLGLYCHPSDLYADRVLCDGARQAVNEDPERYTYTYYEVECPQEGVTCGDAAKKKQ